MSFFSLLKGSGHISFAYNICSGCHAFDIRLIEVPTNSIQMIYKDNPQGIDDYPEMPPQNYLSDEAKLTVAEYILTLKK